MEFPAPAAVVLIAALRLVPVVIVRPVHTPGLAPLLVLIVRPGIIVTLVVVRQHKIPAPPVHILVPAPLLALIAPAVLILLRPVNLPVQIVRPVTVLRPAVLHLAPILVQLVTIVRPALVPLLRISVAPELMLRPEVQAVLIVLAELTAVRLV